MLLFCPNCGNLLLTEENTNGLQFSCSTCPYICVIKKKISSRTYPKLKVNPIDDIFLLKVFYFEN